MTTEPETPQAPVIQAPVDNRPRILLFVVSAALIVGMLLPWATLRQGILYASINGYEGDGIGTAVIGVVLLILALVYKGKSNGGALLALILSGAALWISIPKLFSVPEAGATVGAGLVLTIIGGVMGLIAAFMIFWE